MKRKLSNQTGRQFMVAIYSHDTSIGWVSKILTDTSEATTSKWHTNQWPPSELPWWKPKTPSPWKRRRAWSTNSICKGCNAKYVGETGKTLETGMKQHKAAIRNRYMFYLTTMHSLDTGHQFAFDEAQIIGQAQTKAGYSWRLFIPMKTQLTDISPLTLAMLL